MAKFHSRLSKKEVEELFYKLSAAISETRSVKEAADFLRDLLSYQEAEMIAKRLKIAEFLVEQKTYAEIKKEIKVSYGTIARVQEWLKLQGDGYRKAIKNTKNTPYEKINDIYDYNDDGLRSIKKRYPAYYWPEMLLENIIKNSNKKQREDIRSVVNQLDKMKEKSALFIKLKKLIKQ